MSSQRVGNFPTPYYKYPQLQDNNTRNQLQLL